MFYILTKEYERNTIYSQSGNKTPASYFLTFQSMTTINRFKYSPFVEEINLLRYAILGQGGSQLILIFEAEVEGIKKQYMGPANITGSREENEKSFDLAIFKIVDKDLTVSLRLADQLFKNAESQRAFAVTNV